MLSKKSLSISFILHILLISLSFMIIYKKLPETIFKQIEISDFGLANINQSTTHQTTSSPSTKTKSTGNVAIPKRVEIPKTNIKYDNSLDKISAPANEKLTDDIVNSLDNVNPQNSLVSSNMAQLNEIDDTQENVFSNDNFLNELSDKIAEERRKSSHLKIEGEVSNRKILYSILPKYPQNIQEQAEIKLKFKVNKFGKVVSTIVIKKGNPTLEKLSMEALKKWEFNTISIAQTQTGFITFIFELQ